MPRTVKFLIGLAVALGAGWVGHGPLGRGQAFVDRLDALAKAEIRTAGLPAVHVRFDRDPLRRQAILSGQADQFQREGMGQLKGIDGRVESVAGVSGVRWEGE
jgi:hypothetical protein